MPRPYAVDATDSGDQTTCARTGFVAVLKHVPFTGPWREQKRLQRERLDFSGHLRKHLAVQAEPSRAALVGDVRQLRSNNRHGISDHLRPRETAASDPSSTTKEGGSPNGQELSNHVRGRVA
jgi:hypothetical protein